jgi:hypothetical protein
MIQKPLLWVEVGTSACVLVAPFVACYFIPRGRGFFFLFSLSFSSLGASFFGCFQPCWFFQMPLPSFCFVCALYAAWVLFYVGLFSVRTFFFISFFVCVCLWGFANCASLRLLDMTRNAPNFWTFSLGAWRGKLSNDRKTTAGQHMFL